MVHLNDKRNQLTERKKSRAPVSAAPNDKTSREAVSLVCGMVVLTTTRAIFSVNESVAVEPKPSQAELTPTTPVHDTAREMSW